MRPESDPPAPPEPSADVAEERRRTGVFVTYLIAVMSGLMFLTDGLASVTSLERGTTVVTLPIVLVTGVLLASLMRQLRLPLSFYGITRRHWRSSLRDGLVLSLLLVGIATIVKWRLISDAPSVPLLDPLDTRGGAPGMSWSRFLLLNVAYVVVVVPIQELVARGLLQGMFERIVQSRYRTGLAIVLSNLAFAAAHLFISFPLALVSLVLGLGLGWLYSRSRNLLGVCVAHAVVGVWSLTIVRLQSMLP